MTESGKEEQYEFDVAFSFLAQDEALAEQLADLLEDRLNTFIYSRSQGIVAGTDGEETFNRVFAEEARVVVVLYRDGWGSAGFTLIEETAIRNRAYKEGYDFTVFIPLDDPPLVPKWLPKTRIWIGLNRWGVEGAGSVIEARVQEAGGSVRLETPVERAKRLTRELREEQERVSFLGSDLGVEAALEQLGVVAKQLRELANAARDPETSLDFKVDSDERGVVVRGGGSSVTVGLGLQYGNTLNGSTTFVKLWDGLTDLRGRRLTFEEPSTTVVERWDFDRRGGRLGWSAREGRSFLTTTRFADRCMDLLLDKIREERLGSG